MFFRDGRQQEAQKFFLRLSTGPGYYLDGWLLAGK